MHTVVMSPLTPTIIFENDNVLVINKPSGLVVHPDGRREGETLIDWILETHTTIKGVGEPLVIDHKGEKLTLDRPGIVHRLDRETSGVMVVAKTQISYESLKKQFQDHTIQKEYTAIVLDWAEDRGTVNTAIGRHPNDIRVWTTSRGARGMMRPAVTRYVTQKKFADTKGNRYSLVSLFPETGRTHQLRVHMKSIQHPIIGDGLYAPKSVGLLGFNRVALHARKLTFTDLDGKEYSFEAPMPKEFSLVSAS